MLEEFSYCSFLSAIFLALAFEARAKIVELSISMEGLYTRPFSGDPKDRRTLQGASCATIISGAGSAGSPQFGLAPLSRWAGVINQGGIERWVEWAIEQGADTYIISFSRRNYGEYQSHWRKVIEHGFFCGVYFVSGAGNRSKTAPNPFLMNIPQNIPNTVFAAAGV